jgi:hypothetical protein
MNRAEWNIEVYKELRRRAASGDDSRVLVTYSELVEMTNMPPFKNANWQDHPLSEILGEFDKADTQSERPFISSLVANKASRYPGPGFFKAVAELRRNGNPIPESERKDYWLTEVDRVLKFY